MELDNTSKYLVPSPIVKEITRDSSFPDTTTREQDKNHMDEKPSPWERAQMETGLNASNPIQDGTDYQPSVHEMGTQWKAMDSIGTWADWNDSESVTSGNEDIDQTWEMDNNQN
jgi:hypothetical protein